MKNMLAIMMLLAFVVNVAWALPADLSLKIDDYETAVTSFQKTKVGACYRVLAEGVIEVPLDRSPRASRYLLSAEYRSPLNSNDRTVNSEALQITSGFRDLRLFDADRAADTFIYQGRGDGKTFAAKLHDDTVTRSMQSPGRQLPGPGLNLTVVPVNEAYCRGNWTYGRSVLEQDHVHPRGLLPWIVAGVATSGACASISIAILVVTIAILSGAVLLIFRSSEDKLGEFKPIVPPKAFEEAVNLARINDSWWLALPVLWIVVGLSSLTCSGLSMLTSTFSFFLDLCSAFDKATGILGDDSSGSEILALTGLTLMAMIPSFLGLGFGAGALSHSIRTAMKFSKRVRSDERHQSVLLLWNMLKWWHDNLPVFNDFAAATPVRTGDPEGPDARRMRTLRNAEEALRAALETMTNRLRVVPLGSLVGDTSQVPLKELDGLRVLVTSLKEQAGELGIKVTDEDLLGLHPEPNVHVQKLWDFIRRLLGVKSLENI